MLLRGCGGLAVMQLTGEIRFTPPRRARRRMAGFVMPWMLSRRILRWRLAPPLPRPLPPFPPAERRVSTLRRVRNGIHHEKAWRSVDVVRR